jgi:hypothetical protein
VTCARSSPRGAVPGPGRVLFQAALANFNPHATTTFDFHNDDRAPLLFLAGGKDYVSPAAINESNAKHYRKSAAITAYEEFPLRSHFTLGEDGWEQVADYALNWAVENAATPANGLSTRLARLCRPALRPRTQCWARVPSRVKGGILKRKGRGLNAPALSCP